MNMAQRKKRKLGDDSGLEVCLIRRCFSIREAIHFYRNLMKGKLLQMTQVMNSNSLME